MPFCCMVVATRSREVGVVLAVLVGKGGGKGDGHEQATSMCCLGRGFKQTENKSQVWLQVNDLFGCAEMYLFMFFNIICHNL